MKSRIRGIFLFFTIFILFVDAVAFTGFRNDFAWSATPSILFIYWIIPLIFILVLYLYAKKFLSSNRPGFFAGFYVFTGFFLAFYIPKLLYTIFIFLESIFKLMAYPVSLYFLDFPFGEFMLRGPLNFISPIILPLSILFIIVILAGMAFGRFNFKVRHMGIETPSLPSAFDGFKLVHISDLHLGSLFGHQDKIRKAVEMINRESPDVILFTGDLVNNLAEETEGWTGILNEMKSRYGNFSILGNHDYGEYYNWPDEAARQDNLNKLLAAHKECGFTVLLNQSVSITGETRDDIKLPEIFIAGVENWGLPPFKQYGDLKKALQDIPENAFTVLLSHDPSHWDAEVLKQSAVQLTLSGHTHGMQFGIRTKRIRWSPVQIKYPRWIGLYQKGYQYLHVNPGLGYIGYAGRICIPPEITVITLKRTVLTV